MTIRLGGRNLYFHSGKLKRSENLIKAENQDFYQALANRRTKYYVYIRNTYTPPDLEAQLIRNNYQLEKELSYPIDGVFVFKRNPS